MSCARVAHTYLETLSVRPVRVDFFPILLLWPRRRANDRALLSALVRASASREQQPTFILRLKMIFIQKFETWPTVSPVLIDIVISPHPDYEETHDLQTPSVLLNADCPPQLRAAKFQSLAMTGTVEVRESGSESEHYRKQREANAPAYGTNRVERRDCASCQCIVNPADCD